MQITDSFITSLGRLQGLTRMGGPIFDKELRVASRRRRNYFLRFAYVALLTVFIGYVWVFGVYLGASGSAALQASRMPEVGKSIVTTIVWFQFISLQLIAVVMLSTAISDEIYHRTLGVLMTTPISSFQIVAGKLLSRLLQLLLLLAISLPLLAVVRVFGGVPWDYVVSSLCITVTAVLLAGCFSLFLSTFSRQGHEVFIRAIGILFLLYAVPPVAVSLLGFVYGSQMATRIYPVVVYLNPFAVLAANTGQMFRAAGAGFGPYWPIHCAAMLGGSAVLLALAAVCARRAGLRQATGQGGPGDPRKARHNAAGKGPSKARAAASRAIRPVKGPPILWKELRKPLFKGRRIPAIIATTLSIAVLTVIYVYCIYVDAFDQKEIHILFVCGFLFLGLFRTSTLAATAITSEREGRTWPILLTIPLDNSQIALGKILGCCLQARPFWILLAGHVAVFTVLGQISWLAIVPLAALVATSAFLAAAAGLFWSSCFKRSATASTVNMILLLASTAPVCCPVPLFLVGPLTMAAAILSSFSAEPKGVHSNTPRFLFGIDDLLTGGLMLAGVLAVYLTLAGVAYALAHSNIRRRIF